MTDTVKVVFPDTHIQYFIIHMVRNSTKSVSYKDLKEVCRDFKKIYSAVNTQAGHEALEAFGKKWDGKYLMIQASWELNWNDLTEFYNYPKDIRRSIYTTNASRFFILFCRALFCSRCWIIIGVIWLLGSI